MFIKSNRASLCSLNQIENSFYVHWRHDWRRPLYVYVMQDFEPYRVVVQVQVQLIPLNVLVLGPAGGP